MIYFCFLALVIKQGTALSFVTDGTQFQRLDDAEQIVVTLPRRNVSSASSLPPAARRSPPAARPAMGEA